MFLLLSRIIRQRWLALSLVSALALTACSAIKIGYEQTPTLVYWWMDGHLDLEGDQPSQMREALERLQRWHRQNELPPTADLLARLATLAQAPLDAEQACRLTREAERRADRFMHEAVRTAAPLATRINTRQIGHLSAQFDRKNTQWEEKWLEGPPHARLQRRLDRLVDRYTDFYGSLSTEQVGLLRQQLARSAWTPEWGRRDRLRQQRELLSALMRIEQEKLGAKPAEALLLGVWERWMQPPDATGKAVAQKMVQQGCENLAQLHNSASPEQRQRAARRLRAYEQDLRDLIGP